MKQGWQIKRLVEICSRITDGSHNPPKGVDYSNYRMLSSQNVMNGYLTFDKVRYLSETDFNLENARTNAKKGDVLLTIVGTIGRTCVLQGTEGKITFQRSVAILSPKENYSPYYLMYALVFLNGILNEKANGAAQKGIYLKQLANLEIPVPLLSEQQRIVSLLDAEFAKIDTLKANAERNLQNAKDLFQAALKKELEPKEGWKKYNLQDVCSEYGDYGMSLPSKAFDGIRYLRITDITEWGELNDDKVSVDAENIDEKYMLKEGDVLFARTGATVGKTLVYSKTMGICSYAGYLIRYRPNQELVMPRMLYYITHSSSYYDWVAKTQKASTLPNISAKLYNSYSVCIPKDIEIQQSIISHLDEINVKCMTLQANYEKTIALCDDLKQALLRKAFNGEI